ncbi:MAG: hypothetical protein B7Y56_15850 [Gallionellales bacterium 35-53-114]|nr:MAG: hypothetical protein B7Y56_15850 [Gallionellales bacterium 35-53-114]
MPVIYKFVNEVPTQETIHKFPELTVISWEYDGSKNNGMPEKPDNQGMMNLEDAIDDLANNKFCIHAYSRTGNNLKELVYYISDQEQFMSAFNKALAKHQEYPIEIKFYKDPEWEDFLKLLKDFSKNG